MLALFADSPAVSPDYDASPAAAVVLPSPPLLLTHGITQSATTSTLADIRRMMVQVLSQLNVASPAAVVVPPSPPLLQSARHFIGELDRTCPHCSAKFFPTENFTCCASGAVSLPQWRVPPEPLLTLLSKDDFFLHIRGYNCRLSLGSSVFQDLTKGNGAATFKMGGRSWRLLPHSALPPEGCSHKTAQIYTLPAMAATERRMSISNGGRVPLRSDWLLALHTMLIENNLLVRSFIQSVHSEADWTIGIGAFEPHAVENNDTMVGLLVNGGDQRYTTVIPHVGNGSLVIVPDLDPFYQPLHFVLLFPFGDPEWGLHLMRAKDNKRKRAREGLGTPLSVFDYLKFRMQRREGAVSMHSYGRLFEEWFVDCYLQQENQKLRFMKSHQSKFRRDSFMSVQRQLFDAVPPRHIGSPATHLPSSYVRGARHFRELYADAMTIPAKYGGIDYFLTFTTNPGWPEIVDNASVKNGMNSPDLYCRVFYLKMKALLTDILVLGVLGVVTAYAYAVEFQQRGIVFSCCKLYNVTATSQFTAGLPHLHAMFIVRLEDKPHTPEIVDGVVSAQLPCVSDRVYFEAVTKHMIHGPCGVLNQKHYCMKNGTCRFDYPKRLQVAYIVRACTCVMYEVRCEL